MMARTRANKGLAHGLRALRLFARLSPVDLAGFASAGRLELGHAQALLSAFEEGGYIKRVPDSELLVLSAMAMELPLICGCCALMTPPSTTFH
jgi:DNA-binding IclR family transcriptional regulator